LNWWRHTVEKSIIEQPESTADKNQTSNSSYDVLWAASRHASLPRIVQSLLELSEALLGIGHVELVVMEAFARWS